MLLEPTTCMLSVVENSFSPDADGAWHKQYPLYQQGRPYTAWDDLHASVCLSPPSLDAFRYLDMIQQSTERSGHWELTRDNRRRDRQDLLRSLYRGPLFNPKVLEALRSSRPLFVRSTTPMSPIRRRPKRRFLGAHHVGFSALRRYV